MPSPAAYTIYTFGFLTLILGTSALFDPIPSIETLGLPNGAAPSVQASSLGAIAISVFYLLAAFQENRTFFTLTLLTRSLTTMWALRVGGGWRALGIYEGIGALGTAVALAVGKS